MSDGITKIYIGKHLVGLVGLSNTIEEVKQLNFDDEIKLKNELLSRIKLLNYVPESQGEIYSQALLREYRKALGITMMTEETSEITIRILGPGCSACEKMEDDVRAILTELNIAADIQHIQEINEIAKYGLIRTPSLMINQEIVLNGRSLPKLQLKSLIQQKLQ